jgi:hypothetical protein
MTFITSLCITDVSSEILEQLQELKEQVDALAAAREKVNLNFVLKLLNSVGTFKIIISRPQQ